MQLTSSCKKARRKMKAKKNTQYTTALSTYDEATALQQLLEATDTAIDNWQKEFENDKSFFEEFTITIGGVQTAFILGGPQMEALYQFVKHIGRENCYYVDISTNTVEDHC